MCQSPNMSPFKRLRLCCLPFLRDPRATKKVILRQVHRSKFKQHSQHKYAGRRRVSVNQICITTSYGEKGVVKSGFFGYWLLGYWGYILFHVDVSVTSCLGSSVEKRYYYWEPVWTTKVKTVLTHWFLFCIYTLCGEFHSGWAFHSFIHLYLHVWTQQRRKLLRFSSSYQWLFFLLLLFYGLIK